jgi:predicted RNase H-like nuclease (RuvC/YqgF family)
MEQQQIVSADNSIEDILQWIDEDTDNAFQRLLPSDEYGEDEDASLLWQVIHDAGIYLKQLKAVQEENERLQKDLIEAKTESMNTTFAFHKKCDELQNEAYRVSSAESERDEALKANDLLCKKIDQKDEEIARLKDQFKNQDNVLIARLKEVQACRDQVDTFRKALANRDELNKEYLEALKEWIEVSPCENGCAENDMTCITQRSRYLIQKSQSKEQK